MKVLYIFNHPAPYKVRLLNKLGMYHQIDAIFERENNKNRNKLFYDQEVQTFTAHYLHGLELGEENHFSFELKNYIKRHHLEYDLIIMNGYSTFSEMIALDYLIAHHIPYILYINGGIIKADSKLKEKLKTKYITNAASYFSPCIEADDYLKHYGAKAKIYHYPYSTMEEKEIMPKLEPIIKEQLREKYNIIGKKVFVYAGQFIARKNNLQLINLWRNISKDYSLYLIGDGDQRIDMVKMINKYQLTNIFMLPFMKKNDMLEFFRACDVFITLSKEDIYGHMINEALSQSLPVITPPQVVAARHLLKDGWNGYLIDLEDNDSIKRAITAPISREMPLNCFKTAMDNSFEKMVEAHLEAWEELSK